MANEQNVGVHTSPEGLTPEMLTEFHKSVEDLLKRVLMEEEGDKNVQDGVVKYLKGQRGLLKVLSLPPEERTSTTISALVNEASTRLDPAPDTLQLVDQAGNPVEDVSQAADAAGSYRLNE